MRIVGSGHLTTAEKEPTIPMATRLGGPKSMPDVMSMEQDGQCTSHVTLRRVRELVDCVNMDGLRPLQTATYAAIIRSLSTVYLHVCQ